MELVTRDQLVLAASRQLLDRQRETFAKFAPTLKPAQTQADRFQKMLTTVAGAAAGDDGGAGGAADAEALSDFIDA